MNTIPGRARFIENEPCTLGPDVIAALLDRIEWPSAAEMVRELGRRGQQENIEARRWRDAYEALRNKYEPVTAPARGISCRSDWTCDG